MKPNDTKLKASLVIILCLLVAMFGGVLLVAGTDTLRSRLFLLAVPEPEEQEERVIGSLRDRVRGSNPGTPASDAKYELQVYLAMQR